MNLQTLLIKMGELQDVIEAGDSAKRLGIRPVELSDIENGRKGCP